MIQYNLFLQQPKQKELGVGVLTIHDNAAYFFEGNAEANAKMLGRLRNPEVTFINSRGILLKGYEPDGVDKASRERFKYQEWYCTFVA